MGKSEAGAALVIALKPVSQSVSTISSLLREVQAALREAARVVPETTALFEGDQSPLLTVRIDRGSDGVTFLFEFVNATTRDPVAGVSEPVAKRFMVALEAQLKRRPQRTLWGQPALPGRRRTAEAERDPLRERASVVLAELGRVPAATVSGAGRRIRIEGETAEIFQSPGQR